MCQTFEDENLLKVSDSPSAATEVDKARTSRNASRNAVDNLMFFEFVCLRGKETNCVSARLMGKNEDTINRAGDAY